MSNISVDFDVLNQRGSPAWFTDTFANIPTAGFVGRMFISKDTFAFYRDTGSGWDLIGGPGIGTLTGSGVVGQVSFFNGTQVLAGSNNLFWDNTNGRLGIGTATPGAPLDIHSTGTNAQFNGTGTNNAYLQFQNAGTGKWRIGNTYNAGANSFDIYNNGLTTNAMSISSTTNNAIFTGFIGVGTGATTPPSVITIYSATPDSQFSVVGSSPSIRFNDTLLSPSYSCTIGMATAFSSFITGANIGDLCITNQVIPARAIIFGQGTIERARFSPTGLFLLGTSTPSSFLFDCNGQGRFQNILTLGSTLSNGTYFYTLPSATGTLALTSDITSAINGTTNNLAKFTSANVIGNSGVSDDGTNLTYSSSAKATLLVKAANNTFYGQLAFTNGTNASYGGISYNNSGQYMQFETNTSEWMRLGSDGKLLIGKTASTGGVLQVSNGTNMFNVDYDANGPYITAVNNANSVYKRLTIDASEILFDISASERMRITSGGQVYIGVTSNSAGGRLAIDGTGLVIYSGGQYRQLTQSGNVLEFFNGSNSATLTSAGVWTDASDISIKKIL